MLFSLSVSHSPLCRSLSLSQPACVSLSLFLSLIPRLSLLEDIDGDGDPDGLVVSALDNTVAMYENRRGSPVAWTKRSVTTTLDSPRAAVAADLDE